MTTATVQGNASPAPRPNADRVREILIVDDHPLMCDALALTLKISFGLKNVRTARSLGAAIEQIRAQGAPDAVILDLNLPDARGAEGIVTLRRQLPEVPITMISADLEAAMISAAMAAGAQGYISKSLSREALVDSLRRMWEGEFITPEGYEPEQAQAEDEARAELARRFATLTPQQMKILRLICLGKANKEISYDLSIAEATVKTHITAIMSKINARRRTQAVLLANSIRLFEAG
ncbi:DNA-binding response regulator, NarL/FixJ family, contains REC and HTH domains [Paracoccus alcaliphilus]|uniref:DNA-binding response regulator, NarL/FixJ family, contains REC and HTH domains n=1 Tax=Paracoccus alcaliphilus TaxID=34002 RepID=A0A1H8JIP8_9RHOB|nr:response regulator transcription factor [Paracoccus alcaliphilus]WCR18188.1 response regulator transcription factor [Paracoccus alcaliphilus]SEN80663.1 DNA-binding response regulator, NarL/FixJ family, contains REC and HTH domains [Paracoccus alcaliphilus]